MKSGNGLRLAAVATVGAIALSSCSSAGGSEDETSEGGAVRGGTLNLGQIQDIRSWDPGQAGVGRSWCPSSWPTTP